MSPSYISLTGPDLGHLGKQLEYICNPRVLKVRQIIAYTFFLGMTCLLAGCASGYKAPNVQTKVSLETQAKANKSVQLLRDGANAAETLARAASSLCVEKGPRMPFAVYINPTNQSDDVRTALLKAGLSAQPRIFATHPDAKEYDGKEIVAIDGDKVSLGEFTAYGRIFGKARQGKSPVLSFSDGSKALVVVAEGCEGYTLFDVGDKEIVNIGVGVEIVYTKFLEFSTSSDALLFLMGRSLYYASGPGARELKKVLLPSAALNGFLTGATLGLSRAFLDTKELASNTVRNQYQMEADLFGLQAAVMAGASPRAIVSYAESLAKRQDQESGSLPKDLRFDQRRLSALKAEGEKLFPIVATVPRVQ